MFEFRKNIIMVLDTTNSKYIHTWFCRRIDMWFYDENKKLINTLYSVRPCSIYKIPPKTKYVIEMTI